MTWNVCRSPIHGLGSWLSEKACSIGRFCSLLRFWYSYSQLSDPASVTGVQKLNPCGTAVAGKLLPREKVPLAIVPRVVTTLSVGRVLAGGVGVAEIFTSSSQPCSEPGPSGLS